MHQVWTALVTPSRDSIHLEETPYLPLNAAGQLGQQQELGTVFRFQLNTEPSAIAIVVHNLGPQINMDGSLYETNTVTVVDTFVQPLNGAAAAAALPFSPVNRGTAKAPFFPSFVAATVPGQQQNVQLQGRLVGTQLSLTFSVSCGGTLVGPGCDLACNNSAANPSSAICQSRRTGFFSLCRWTSGGGNAAQQVTDCKNCPWGIKESAYCADGQGGVLEPSHAGVVSSSYYTAFVVLCCVCGLLLLCLLVAGLLTCKKIVRMRRDSPASFRRVHQQQAASRGGGGGGVSNAHISTRGDPERALLTSATRPTEDNDTGGFAAFRLGPENGNGAKPPPPPYSVRSNGNAGTDVGGGTHHPQRVAADALTNPFPLPRSNASTASASGRETPSVVAAGGGERQRFPPPLAIGTKTSKTLSPPRFQPLPHLGPQIRQAAAAAAAAGGVPADSLNSSFAGMSPPSVSADV
uniref:Uncharacterized protein n=1 Tax=Globodera pallida TaxID=36090 RepID=A0A183BST1_GLOPA